MHNYHTAIGTFPVGVDWFDYDKNGVLTEWEQYGVTRGNFHLMLFAYVEETTTYDLVDFELDSVDVLWAWGNNMEASDVPLPYLLCPSDGLGGTHAYQPLRFDGLKLARNNYMGVFDGYQVGDMVYTGDRSKLAVFSAVRATSIRNILDGTSHTMAMAEGLTGPAGIYRGTAWTDQACGALVFTEFGPNSLLPDRCDGNSVNTFYCLNDPGDNRPSVLSADHRHTSTCGARSRHPTGVLVLMADSSCRFVEEDIELITWRALATIAGNEVIGED